MRQVRAGCMLCEAGCGLVLELDGERVHALRGDPEDPLSQGHLCPKALAIPDLMGDPDRVREPLKRVGDRFEPISWAQALSEIGAKVAQIQREHGKDALGLYLGNPNVHTPAALVIPSFVQALNTRSRFSATSVDQLPHMLASLQLLGHQLLLPVPDVDRTDWLLVIGANPLVSNGSLMTAGGIERRLRALRARGGRLLVVDPRRTETGKLADEHHFIRPGGDAALLAGMLHALLHEGLLRPERLAPWVDGLDELREAVSHFSPERVASRAGLEPALIRRLAQELAAAERGVVYGRMGASVQEYGGLCAWLILVLNTVTGNLDRPGGVMFTRPAVDLVAFGARMGYRGHFGAWRSRVRGLPEFGGELPAAALAEELDTPGPGQVRALITVAGNPALSLPNGPRVERALAGLELLVCVDIALNETTRHAHYILPTAFGFERDHYDVVFHTLAVRDTARFNPAVLPPPPGVRPDHEVLLELALAILAAGGGRRRWAMPWMLRGLRWLGLRRLLDGLLRVGPRRLSLRQLLRQPAGLDLGPLEPALPERLYTPNRRVQLVAKMYLDDLERLRGDLERPVPPLLLIGRRALRSNNSWMHNSLRLAQGRRTCTLRMHPDDAQARGLSDGATVRVRSRVGAVVVPLELSEDLAPGVVSLPHGWGHDRPGAAQRVARAHAGASLNDLTDEQRVDPLSGNAVLSGVEVEVEVERPPLGASADVG